MFAGQFLGCVFSGCPEFSVASFGGLVWGLVRWFRGWLSWVASAALVAVPGGLLGEVAGFPGVRAPGRYVPVLQLGAGSFWGWRPRRPRGVVAADPWGGMSFSPGPARCAALVLLRDRWWCGLFWAVLCALGAAAPRGALPRGTAALTSVGVLWAVWGLGVAGLGVWGWVGARGFLLGSGRCCAGLELVACEAGRWRRAGFPGVRALVVMVADPGGGMSLGWS